AARFPRSVSQSSGPVLYSRFLSHDPASTASYSLSLHDALPIWMRLDHRPRRRSTTVERARIANTPTSTRAVARPTLKARISPRRSEEHTSELQSRFDLVCRLLLENKESNKISKTQAVTIQLDGP